MSLWNYSHGSRVWEIDVNDADDSTVTELVSLAWSPDGMGGLNLPTKLTSGTQDKV